MAAKNFKLHFAAAILFFLSLSAFSNEFSTTFSTDLYSIEYNEKSQNLVETINQTLASHFQRILNFWNNEAPRRRASGYQESFLLQAKI